MASLADLIERQSRDLVRRFAERDRRDGAATSLTDDVIVDAIHPFLHEMVAELRHAATTPDRSPSATEHGAQRFNLGYDVGGVIREYGLLYELLLELAEENGIECTAEEIRQMSRFFFRAIVDSATQYAAARDHEMVEQARKHVAFLAHELRNPLGSARFALSLMNERGELAPSSIAASLDRSLTRMANLLDDALVSLRLHEVGALHYEWLSLHEVLGQLVTEITAEAEAKHQTIVVEGSARVRADRRALCSALSNLIRNAVKFTPSGGAIHLRAREARGSVVIEVEDSCGGLPEGTAKRLFDPFVQAGADRSGFGLGLAIAEQAARAHGGALRAHDLPGKGCVFVLDVPAEPPP
jgi:signal transduction histidine kinase